MKMRYLIVHSTGIVVGQAPCIDDANQTIMKRWRTAQYKSDYEVVDRWNDPGELVAEYRKRYDGTPTDLVMGWNWEAA